MSPEEWKTLKSVGNGEIRKKRSGKNCAIIFGVLKPVEPKKTPRDKFVLKKSKLLPYFKCSALLKNEKIDC